MAQNKGNCVFSHVTQQVLLTPIEGVELRCEFFFILYQEQFWGTKVHKLHE
jgi:hypothetical protein